MVTLALKVGRSFIALSSLLKTKPRKTFLISLQQATINHKLNERNRKKSLDERHFCNVCCTEINPEDTKNFVKCWLCLKYTCRSFKCANWLPKAALWECELCQTSKESMAQTSSWVAEQFSFNEDKLVYPLRARSEIFIPINECNDNTINFDSVSQVGANSTIITTEQKLKIREYVEEIVSKLLGGNLDTISVNQLSKSENCNCFDIIYSLICAGIADLQVFDKYHLALSEIFLNTEKALNQRILLQEGEIKSSTPRADDNHQGVTEEMFS
uniref:Uncharacterized protein n=1 Tax=Glossina brevipalpis TaxID=37001 RepID=A0A1A9WMV2_9MUSC